MATKKKAKKVDTIEKVRSYRPPSCRITIKQYLSLRPAATWFASLAPADRKSRSVTEWDNLVSAAESRPVH